MKTQKGKAEETDKVALKIKQEVLKELRARQSGGHLKVILLPNEKDLEEAIDLAISKTHFACIKEAGFKDADEEIARMQEKHQQELESAVMRAKLDSMEFHTKHMNELLAKNNSDNLRIFNKMKEELKQDARQQTISEVFAKMKKYEQKSFTENKTFIPETSYVILTWRAYQSLKKKFGGVQ